MPSESELKEPAGMRPGICTGTVHLSCGSNDCGVVRSQATDHAGGFFYRMTDESVVSEPLGILATLAFVVWLIVCW